MPPSAATHKGLPQALRSKHCLDLPGLFQGSFHQFRSLSEAKALAIELSANTPNPAMAAMGLTEIFVNAIEHGNLGIDYNFKASFKNEKQWFDEINRRLLEPDNINKYVEVIYEKTSSEIGFTVKDQGKGFDWTKFQRAEEIPLNNRNGRGILISKGAAFDDLIYHAPGNKVTCIINLK